jgi:hypothetical protein
MHIRPALQAIAALAVLVLSLYGYVYWKSYINQLELDGPTAWSYPQDQGAYGKIGDAWGFVREELPRGAAIAYANTYFTYPLMGFAYDHRVVYVPTRHNLERFVDMPEISKRITGEEIVGNIVEMLRQNPDREQWLRRLRLSGAQYLIIGKELAETRTEAAPPEVAFANDLSFRKVFENEAAIVYQIRP